MANNGTVDTINNVYYQAGSGAWSDLSTWTDFESWSVNPVQLEYNTNVIDLGVKKPVIPVCTVSTEQGQAYVVVTYGDTESGGVIQSPTQLGTELYFDLDYSVSGYTSSTYTGFSARYVQFTVYITARNADNTANLTPVLKDFNTALEQEFAHEYFFDIDSSTLAGDASARTIPVQTLTTPVAAIYYSLKYDATTSAANGKYAIHTVSKSTPSFTVRDLDAFPEDTTGIDHNGIDIHVVGFPTLTTTDSGGIRRT